MQVTKEGGVGGENKTSENFMGTLSSHIISATSNTQHWAWPLSGPSSTYAEWMKDQWTVQKECCSLPHPPSAAPWASQPIRHSSLQTRRQGLPRGQISARRQEPVGRRDEKC